MPSHLALMSRQFFNETGNPTLQVYIERLSKFAKAHGRAIEQVLFEARDAEESTALHNAAKCGSLPVIQYIVAQQPLLIDLTDNQGNTALHWLARGKNSVAVSFVLKVSESAARYRPNSANESPLQLSLWRDNHLNFQILIQGAYWDKVTYIYLSETRKYS